MSEPYIGEIRMFAGNFAPRGWAKCDGQLIAVAQNDALFSLLGTVYGGDGRTTFGLPDMRGRLPVHPGDGPGVDAVNLGQKGGEEQETILLSQLPSHDHGPVTANSQAASDAIPTTAVNALSTVEIYATSNAILDMSTNAVSSVGGTQSHNNLMPSLCLNFIIALFGIYPSRH